METKGVTCKIPLDLHNQISEEIRETESTMSKFIEMIIREHYEKGANRIMEKGRTLAFQVSEELFQRVKEYLENYEKAYHRRLTQKEFVIGLIEQALEEAEEEFEAARAAEHEEQAENGWEAAEIAESDEDEEVTRAGQSCGKPRSAKTLPLPSAPFCCALVLLDRNTKMCENICFQSFPATGHGATIKLNTPACRTAKTMNDRR